MKRLSILLLILLPAFVLYACGGDDMSEIREVFELLAPEDLPDIPFRDVLTEQERRYLNVGEGPFTLKQIGADVVLIKFLNIHCPACQAQAPIINRAYHLIEKRDDLRDRIKFLAVAAGNNAREVNGFKKEYDIPFPLIPDPLFYSYDSVGNPGGLPFLLIVTIHPENGHEPVAKGHAGLIISARQLAREAEEALDARAIDWDARIENLHLGEWTNLKLNVSDSYLMKLLGESASEVGIRAETIEPVQVTKGCLMYRILTPDKERFWAKVAGRVAICNICHNIFFIILFNDEGMIVNYTSVRVTKGNNIIWDENDDDFMKKKLIGRSILGENVFNPEVDTVSTATMSTALIFDTIRRLGYSYRIMEDRNLVDRKERPKPQ